MLDSTVMSCPEESETTPPAEHGKDKRRSLLPPPKYNTRTRSPSSENEPQQTLDAEASTEADLKLGASVLIGGVKQGVLRYVGSTEFAPGEWCGVELDDPDGKHDGSVEGVQYFSCSPLHGIFAPLCKITPVTHEDVFSEGSSNTSKESSPSPEKSRVRQARHMLSGLPKPSKRPKTSSDSETSVTSELEECRGKSKLARPKAVSWTLEESLSQGDHDSTSSRDSSLGRGVNESLSPERSTYLPRVGKGRSRGIPRPNVRNGKTKETTPVITKKSKLEARSGEEEELEDTISDSADDSDDLDTARIQSTLVDSHTAHTLTYCMESSGSDVEIPRQQSIDAGAGCVEGGDEFRGTTLISSVPDLLTSPGVFVKDLLQKDISLTEVDTTKSTEENLNVESDSSLGWDFSSLDILTDEQLYAKGLLSEELERDPSGLQLSEESSLAILSDHQLAENSLVTKEFIAAFARHREALLGREAIELQEKEIDQEISGISTPEMEMSSGRDPSSSPEPENVKEGIDPSLDITFEIEAGQTSTPVEIGSKTTGGEKMASPTADPTASLAAKHGNVTYNMTSGVDKRRSWPMSASSSRLIEPMDVDGSQVSVQMRDKTYTLRNSVEEYPKRMRTSADLDNLDVMSMSASFELAKTAVAQYANLMQGAEKERQHHDLVIKEQGITKTTSDHDNLNITHIVQKPSPSLHNSVSVEKVDSGGSQEVMPLLQRYTPLADSADECSSDSMVESSECVQIEDSNEKIMARSGLAVDLCEQIPDTDENMHDAHVVVKQQEDTYSGELDSEGNHRSSPSDEDTLNGQQRQVDHVEMQLITTELGEQDQLISDLQEGHRKSERPVSMVSTCSADTGIVADLHPRGKAERPISLISTSSVDTGYQAETDGEHAASPLGEVGSLHSISGHHAPSVSVSSSYRGEKNVPESAGKCLSRTQQLPATTATATLLPLLESQHHIHMDESDSVGEWLEKSTSDIKDAVKEEEEEEMEASGDESNTEAVQENDTRPLEANTEVMLDSGPVMEAMDESLSRTMVEETVHMKDAAEEEELAITTSNVPDQLVDMLVVDRASECGEVNVMSESTEKDAGSETKLKGNSKSGASAKDTAAKSKVDKSPKKIGVTLSKVKSKLTLRSKTIEKKGKEVEKEKPVKKSVGKPIDKKSKESADPLPKKTGLSSAKSSPAKGDVSTASKVPNKKAKSASSKLSEYFKRPTSGKPSKEDNDTAKAKKDLSNSGKKKSEISKIIEPEKKSVARKLDIDPSQRNIVVAPITQDDSNGHPPKRPVKRERPKSKWENIMSQIEVGKQGKPGKGSGETSKGKSSDSVSAPAAKNPRSSSLPVSAESNNVSRRTLTKDTSKLAPPGIRTASATPSLPRPRSALSPTPSSSRPSSLVGSASDMSQLDSQLASKSNTISTSRPSSAYASPRGIAKPSSRTMTALKKRERSESIGSDSQSKRLVHANLSSVSSQVSSSQGSRASPHPTPTRPVAKRKSLTETSPNSKTLSDTESRRASVTNSSKLTTPKVKKTAAQPTSLKKPSTNQNRNKTTKATSAVKGSSGAQPDLVATSVGRAEAARQEVARLGALCEARTKQLNTARWQLQRQAAGFDAMAVLVRYLTEELDAFSCPQLKTSLEETRHQLARAGEQLVELTNQRDALIAEIQCLTESHQKQVEQLQCDHENVAQSLNQQLQQHQLQLEQKESQHEKHVTSLKEQQEQLTKEQKHQHEKRVSELQAEQHQRLKQIDKDNNEQTEDLQKHHQLQLEEMTLRFEEIKLTLSEKVEVLRSECEEMRRREQTYQEACRQDSVVQVQRALAPYQHLPQEIDSLKAVLELKNEEIRQLRAHKHHLEQQMEELPKKEAAIKRLEQKMENLEAIVDLKTDSEKHLSEKHHLLLRKFDKESKQNKRLSMDIEELVWRVQNESGSPDLLQRSISHSPPNSGASTPEPFRQRRPHNTMSPRSPRGSALDPDMAHQGAYGVTLRGSPTSRGVNLQRSGTYDLLDQEYEDENQLKRKNELRH